MNKFEVMKQEIDKLLAQYHVEAAVYIETDEDVISINQHQAFSSASLIKLPILLTVLSEVEKGNFHLTEKIKTGRPVGGAGVLFALSNHSSFTWRDLLTLMMIVSDNTATNWIIEHLGMESIKRLIDSLGLEQTSLNRKMMDFEAIERGIDNQTSAFDMVQCLKFLRNKAQWTSESLMIMEDIMGKQQFTLLTAELEEEHQPMISYGSKSGSLQGIQHDCAYFYHEDKYVYAAVLTTNLPNQLLGKQLIGEIGMAIKRYLK